MIVSSTATLITGCSQTVYVKQPCPYIEPLEKVDTVVLRTTYEGGFTPPTASKAIELIRDLRLSEDYSIIEMQRLKEFVNEEDN